MFKVDAIENLPPCPSDHRPPNQASSGQMRDPLISIPDPTQISKSGEEKESGLKARVEITPTKPKGKAAEKMHHFRTPEKQGNGAIQKNRFGWSATESHNDIANSMCQSSRNGGLMNMTPRTTRATTVARPSQMETTPTKSVSKPSNAGFVPMSSSRVPGSYSRNGNYAALSRGLPVCNGMPVVVNTVEVPHFDLKEDPSFWIHHNVQVIIRVRPLNSAERGVQGYNRCVKQESSQNITWIGQPESRFAFDHVACETVDQEMLFRKAGLPMVENCLSGYNSCMFAYGQTGSGKTYTMVGDIDDLEFKPSLYRGMTPRIFEYLFARIRAEEESRRDDQLKYSCKCSFLEIYNEQITDLLNPSATNLLLREDMRKGIYVENLSEFEVYSVGDILKLLAQGSLNRKVAATNMNMESSRSHSVFTCVIESKWERESTVNLRFARLNLVDLAGSERQKTSGAEGERLKEAANINKSLSTLGHVIMVLVDVANGKTRHVPYRDSKLTFLLQDSLGGNSKTIIIANITPSASCAAETLNTLKFAQRAKLIQNNAIVNEDSSGDVSALQHQIQILKEQLSALKRQPVSRSLLFGPLSLQYNTEDHEDVDMEIDQPLSEESVQFEAEATKLSSQQLKSLENIVAGALRRENIAETSIKKLEVEIEHLNRLVHQREKDAKCSKMQLKFREDKIRRMESFLKGVKTVDSYLLEENASLLEEIQMLQEKVDKNPEVTRFAVENIRLSEELKRFQEFYEEGEREILLSEVSELRDKLIQHYDENIKHSLHSNIPIAPKDSSAPEEREKCEELLKPAEQILNLELELDILKIILKEERSSRVKADELTTCLSRELKLAEESILSCHKQYEDVNEQLEEAKSKIELLQSQHLLSVNELEDLKHNNKQHAELLRKKELEFEALKQRSCHESNDGLVFNGGKRDEILFQHRIDNMQASLEKAKMLNASYQRDHVFQKANQDETDIIRQQVEEETAQVILCLQDELSALQQQVQDSCWKEKEVESKMNSLTSENEALKEQIKEKEKDAELNSREWELLSNEIEGALKDGDEALLEASEQLDCICSYVPSKGNWVSEQVQRLIKQASEKELVIEDLNACLENANARLNDMECKLRSLREATLVITESHQKECSEKEKEIQRLRSELSAKSAANVEMMSSKDATVTLLRKEIESAQQSLNTLQAEVNHLNAEKLELNISERQSREGMGIVKAEIFNILATVGEFEDQCLHKIKLLNQKVEQLQQHAEAALVITESHQKECSEKEKEIHRLRSELSAKSTANVEIMSSKDAAVALLHKEIESAQQSLNTLQAEVNHLNAEKLKLNISERQSREGIGMVKAQIVHILATVGEFEDQCLHKIKLLNQKVEQLQQHAEAALIITESHQKDCSEKEKEIHRLRSELSAKSTENVEMMSSKDATVTLLRKEIESAQESLTVVQAEVNQLNAEKLKLNISERQSREGMGMVKAQIFDILATVGEFEDQCLLKIKVLNQKVEQLRQHAEAHQKDCSEKEKEIHSLRSELSAKSTANVEIMSSKDAAVALLHKEIESAQESLTVAQAEVNHLNAEKLKLNISERQSREGMGMLKAQIFDILATADEFEDQCLRKIKLLNQKVEQVEQYAEEASCYWGQAKEIYESELNNVTADVATKTAEASCLFSKFEEAQDIMKEADVMIKGLMIANETMKLEMEDLKRVNLSLHSERDGLVQEIQELHSYAALDNDKCHKLVQELETVISQARGTSEGALLSMSTDISSLKSQFLDSRQLIILWLEDIWSEIIVKDSTSSVLHLCHMGILLEAVTKFTAENFLLKNRLSESDVIVSHMREQNKESVQELEAFSLLKEKLLADIKKSFDHVTRKENETAELGAKFRRYESKISDLQLQEELLLERSNYLGFELAKLVKDLNYCNSDVIASLLEQEKLLNDNKEATISQEENFMRELSAKDLELLIVTSELQRLVDEKADMETSQIECYTVMEHFKKEFISLSFVSNLMQQLMFERDNEVIHLQKKVGEADLHLTQTCTDIISLDVINTVLREELVLQKNQMTFLNEKFDSELHEASEYIAKLSEHLQRVEYEHSSVTDKLKTMEGEFHSVKEELNEVKNQNSILLMDVQVKDSEVMSCQEQIHILVSEKCSLQESMHDMESKISFLQEELDLRRTDLKELQCSHTSANEKLCQKSQELQNHVMKMNMLEEENLSLKNELSRLQLSKFEDFSMMSSTVAKCLNMSEAAEMESYRMCALINEKIDTVSDQLCQDICRNLEEVVRIEDTLQPLDVLVEDITAETSSLQAELLRKDEILKGLSFDLSLLQESASSSKDQKDEIEELKSSLNLKEDELKSKSQVLDDAVADIHDLEAQIEEKIDNISLLERDLSAASDAVASLSKEKAYLRSNVDEMLGEKVSLQRELDEQKKHNESLEIELSDMGNSIDQANASIESLKSDLKKIINERDHMHEKIQDLEEKLDTAQALAEECEAISMEAKEIAESNRIYAEEKEEEVKLLEISVQEVDRTVYALENKVDILQEDAERQRLQREELEIELNSLKHQIYNLESADSDIKRHLEEKEKNMQKALALVQELEKDLADKEAEISRCKSHINELNLHAEAQASEYKKKFKALEAMAGQVKIEGPSSHGKSSSSNKVEKNATKPRGSGSPFKCIGIGLTQQLKLEKDEDLTVERLRIQELEALAANRQKEIFVLNNRLASAESMTHDVIRDLLGVKMDMTNYVSFLDKQQVQKVVESDILEKGELVAVQLALEKLHQKDRLLTAENEALMVDVEKYKKRVMELEREVSKLFEQQNLQQQIHHHAKIKEENKNLKQHIEKNSAMLQNADTLLTEMRKKLAESRRLYTKLKEAEDERVQLSQELVGLCTSILKAAGIKKAPSDISVAAAEEALKQLRSKFTSLEKENVKLKSRIESERVRLSEVIMKSPPPAVRTRAEDNCTATPRRRPTHSPFFSAVDR